MTDKARILVFTGDGKGKTTAAIGMAFRASGHGKRVLVVQFIKDAESGELSAAEAMANIRIVQTGLGFVPDVGSDAFGKHVQAAKKGLAISAGSIGSGDYDLIILDEVCVAVDKGLLREEDVAKAISAADPKMSVVLTGRGASQGLIDLADTVSNIECVKHGYGSGIAAQKGVEF